MNTQYDLLSAHFPHLTFEQNIPLAPFTTVKIGGPAEIFCEIKKLDDLIAVCQFAHQHQIPLTMLGWGANTLISDNGIQGLVIKNSTNEITVLDTQVDELAMITQVTPRWKKDEVGKDYYDFSDLDFAEEEQAEKVLVEVSAGVSLPMLINTLLNQGITGLQWFARIPASLGGAIYNNIHGGTHFISEYVLSVSVLSEDNTIQTLANHELDFDYDYSRFHKTKEVILSAKLLLYKGDVLKAKTTSIEWATRKKIQPQNSLGCVFQNLTQEQQALTQLSNPAAGYIIDQVLGLKGHTIGQAQISEKHSAFIENLGAATASDYLALIRLIQTKTQEKLGIKLKPEIFFLGFKDNELEDILVS